MTYLEAKTTSETLTAEVYRLAAALRVFPKDGPMGLHSDTVRATPEYRAAKPAYAAAFERLRAFNGRFVKVFAKEIREDRRARHAASLIATHG